MSQEGRMAGEQEETASYRDCATFPKAGQATAQCPSIGWRLPGLQAALPARSIFVSRRERTRRSAAVPGARYTRPTARPKREKSRAARLWRERVDRRIPREPA